MVSIIQNTLMISSFVFVMMLLIEYLSVLTHGRWQAGLHKKQWKQYIVCSFLGVVPGCLGAFTVVAMYSHRVVTLGAVVAAMIATSGDEAYMMLAKRPLMALGLFAGLFVLGIFSGALTDRIFPGHNLKREIGHMALEIHPSQDEALFSRRDIAKHWRSPSPTRGVMTVGLALLALGIILGFVDHTHAFEMPAVNSEQIEKPTGENNAAPPGESAEEKDAKHKHKGWNWVRISLLVTTLAALFIVATVPDHFLDEHLWEHVALKHLPRIFLWTLGAIAALYLLNQYVDVEKLVKEHHWVTWAALGAACVAGLIPQSGPHMAFLALYLAGAVPFSVLLASSIVQDGHGMLPLLAESRRGFLVVKAINFVIGAAVGAAVMGLGY